MTRQFQKLQGFFSYQVSIGFKINEESEEGYSEQPRYFIKVKSG